MIDLLFLSVLVNVRVDKGCANTEVCFHTELRLLLRAAKLSKLANRWAFDRLREVQIICL